TNRAGRVDRLCRLAEARLVRGAQRRAGGPDDARDVAERIVRESGDAAERVRDRPDEVRAWFVLVAGRATQRVRPRQEESAGVEAMRRSSASRGGYDRLRHQTAAVNVFDGPGAPIRKLLMNHAPGGVVLILDERDASSVDGGDEAVRAVVRIPRRATARIGDGYEPALGVVVVVDDAGNRIGHGH